jgi:hypothetical protein
VIGHGQQFFQRRFVIVHLLIGMDTPHVPPGWLRHGVAAIGSDGADAVLGASPDGPLVLATHYDTRPRADRDPVDPDSPVPGANDGASGVAVLLELARVLPERLTDQEVWLVFFDGEDSGGLDGWEQAAVPAATVAQACDGIVLTASIVDTWKSSRVNATISKSFR